MVCFLEKPCFVWSIGLWPKDLVAKVDGDNSVVWRRLGEVEDAAVRNSLADTEEEEEEAVMA
jgi:hypothetical protein